MALSPPRWSPHEHIRSDGHSILFVGGQGTGKTTAMLACVPPECNIFVLLAQSSGSNYDSWVRRAGAANVWGVSTDLARIAMPPGWVPPQMTQHAKTTGAAYHVAEKKETPLGDQYMLEPKGTAARVFLWLLRLVKLRQDTRPETTTVIVMDDVISQMQSETSRKNGLVDMVQGLLTTLRHEHILLLASAHFLADVYVFASKFDTWIMTSVPTRLPDAAAQTLQARLPDQITVSLFTAFFKNKCAPSDSSATDTANRVPRKAAVLDAANGIFTLGMSSLRAVALRPVGTREQRRASTALSSQLERRRSAQVVAARRYYTQQQ